MNKKNIGIVLVTLFAVYSILLSFYWYDNLLKVYIKTVENKMNIICLESEADVIEAFDALTIKEEAYRALYAEKLAIHQSNVTDFDLKLKRGYLSLVGRDEYIKKLDDEKSEIHSFMNKIAYDLREEQSRYLEQEATMLRNKDTIKLLLEILHE